MAPPQKRPRYICSNCDTPYGQLGAARPVYGFCRGCWDWHLAVMRRNVWLANTAWCLSKGLLIL